MHPTPSTDLSPSDLDEANSERPRIAADLEAHGLRATRQRMLVATVLLAGPRHLTAEQILTELKASGRRVSKATVYNTLNALADHGLIREIHLGGDQTVYDSTRAPHHHFHYLDTGELVDIPANAVVIGSLPPLPPGTETASVELVIGVRRKAE